MGKNFTFSIGLPQEEHVAAIELMFETNKPLGKHLQSLFDLDVMKIKMEEGGFINFQSGRDCREDVQNTVNEIAKKVKEGENVTKKLIEASKKSIAADFTQERPDNKQNAQFARNYASMLNLEPFQARTENQSKFYKMMSDNDVTFAVGPAGTGKTRAAVAKAFEAFKKGEVKRIYLTRAAVDGEENLGFLPGTMQEKMEPYVRPLYDEAIEVLGGGLQAIKLLEELMAAKVVQILPVGKMRGLNIKDAYLVVDEAQNCTYTQLKTTVTRLTGDTKMAYMGDVQQIDLVPKSKSGLAKVMGVLKKVMGYGEIEFSSDDVTRHPFVKAAVKAFEASELAEEAIAAKKPSKAFTKSASREASNGNEKSAVVKNNKKQGVSKTNAPKQ